MFLETKLNPSYVTDEKPQCEREYLNLTSALGTYYIKYIFLLYFVLTSQVLKIFSQHTLNIIGTLKILPPKYF